MWFEGVEHEQQRSDRPGAHALHSDDQPCRVVSQWQQELIYFFFNKLRSN